MTIIPAEAEHLFSVGEIEVSYKTNALEPLARITSSSQAFTTLREFWSDKINWVEEFYIMCLNRANDCIGIYLVSVGGTAGTCVDPKIIFQVALGCHASSIILAHNHPSGNLAPSQADKDLTRKYKELGNLMDLKVLDHLILSPQEHVYYSFADEGIL